MKRLTPVAMLCLMTLTAAVCGKDEPIMGLPSPVYEGDVLPPLSFGPHSFGTLQLHADTRYGPEAPFFGTKSLDPRDGGSISFDDIMLPNTGTFTFVAKLDNIDTGYSEPFTVTTRNFAEVTCQEDGSIIGAASIQATGPTIIGDVFCKLTKGGSEPEPANFGTVRCDFLNVSATCTAPSGNCFDRGPGVRIPSGTSVNASWRGGAIAEGSATAIRPGSLDAGLPPAMQSLGAPLRLPFQGTPDGGGTVHLTVVQQAASTVAIDCWVPETAGVVEVPPALLGNLTPGAANVLLRIEGRTRNPSGDFNTTLIVPGPSITGYVDAVPITFVP